MINTNNTIPTISAASLKLAAATQTSGSQDFLTSIQSQLQVPQTLNDIFDKAAQTYNIPANLLKAVGKAESSYNPNAVSHCGAQGIMQLMPSTAKELGVTNAFDPEQNIMGGAKYLSDLLKRYSGDAKLALAAYNAGSNNVSKYGGIPPFAETQNYVAKVMEYAGNPSALRQAASKVGISTSQSPSLTPSGASLLAAASSSILSGDTSSSVPVSAFRTASTGAAVPIGAVSSAGSSGSSGTTGSSIRSGGMLDTSNMTADEATKYKQQLQELIVNSLSMNSGSENGNSSLYMLVLLSILGFSSYTNDDYINYLDEIKSQALTSDSLSSTNLYQQF